MVRSREIYLLLARRAVDGTTPSHPNLRQRLSAGKARLAVSLVNAGRVLSNLPLRVHIIVARRSATADRLVQNRADLTVKALGFRGCQRSRWAQGVDARPVQ